MKTCLVPNCERKYTAKGFCGMHYERIHRGYELGDYKARKSPDGTCNLKSREGRNLYNRLYRLAHPDMKSINFMNKSRFGGIKDKVLERDNYKCRVCGMTDEEHLKEWNRHITVDHIDGSGRYSIEHNNSLKNLWTLCYRCHGRRDSLRHWLSLGKPISKEVMVLLKLE